MQNEMKEVPAIITARAALSTATTAMMLRYSLCGRGHKLKSRNNKLRKKEELIENGV